MWSGAWRDEIWATIDQPWDVVIVGGGIVGAGVLREATSAGLRALLVERRDFGWGASSRSTKMVHGGFRYLAEGHVRMARDAIRQRRRLLAERPGLVTPLGFLFAGYRGDRPGLGLMRVAAGAYDLLAGQWVGRRYDPASFRLLAPHAAEAGLRGGLGCREAQTDDARLVLRLIREAVADGGSAINYVSATSLLRENGRVTGVRLHDPIGDRQVDVRTSVVVNATGAWADRLREQVGGAARMRPLRGSHLVFPAWRLPVAQAISFRHPLDRRYVVVLPWEGVTLVGTTDLDHRQALDDEPAVSPEEVAYLMAAVEARFPALALTLDDVVATFSGVRPVVDSGQVDPSKAARDHVVLEERGLVTVTGGKLTTFQLIALEALQAICAGLPEARTGCRPRPGAETAPRDLDAPLSAETRMRLIGRYGADAPALVASARPGELEAIPGTPSLWAELRWASRAEGIVHLDDLLLRRVRLGLMLPAGGAALLPAIRAICQPELGWDDARWQAEEQAYLAQWQAHYSLPNRAAVPDWRELLDAARATQPGSHPRSKRGLAGALAVSATIVGTWAFWRLHKVGQSAKRTARKRSISRS